MNDFRGNWEMLLNGCLMILKNIKTRLIFFYKKLKLLMLIKKFMINSKYKFKIDIKIKQIMFNKHIVVVGNGGKILLFYLRKKKIVDQATTRLFCLLDQILTIVFGIERLVTIEHVLLKNAIFIQGGESDRTDDELDTPDDDEHETKLAEVAKSVSEALFHRLRNFES
ncbi:hypothetical protein BpHYR1_028833 [Brachionus plicatilis]|uniref:Uncharacterized protein n=1 Tax=Brachionus plicatilis TaxID=10195 RepID=A0A3M7PWG1_BRAPC|nr:hypothetical protein BpHYR1_028833 [Brachionus plicatilis]